MRAILCGISRFHFLVISKQCFRLKTQLKGNIMNKDIIKGSWKELKVKVRKNWGNLTDDTVNKMTGSYEELAGALQKTYGYNKERIDQEIKKFTDTHNQDK